MSSMVVMTETDERSPLLQNSSHSAGEITSFASPSPDHHDGPSSATRPTDPKQRLVSLDVFRGLTVALMILVDDAGGAFPSINHSPWFGVTLADFVMPFFLFSVGISVSLVFKKVSSKPAATKKVVLRTIKLFLLGLILQGGYFHGREDLTYGVDVNQIRWMGVLQRISIGYLLASITEIWCVNNNEVNSAITFVKKYYIQWFFVFVVCVLYMSLLYGLYIPDWSFEVMKENFSLSVPEYGKETQMVLCGVRGSLEPPCNAVGLIDRLLLGESHLYKRPVYKRTQECSINSPDYGPLPPNAPAWCLAPFDPEGLLSSLMAAITCLLGLQYGHVMVHYKGYMHRIVIWLVCSSSLLVLGYVLMVIGIPLSKPLYTLSYMCITAGASGILLIAIFYMIMASSLNGLSVGDPLPENLMDSPARSDSMFYLRDELPLQYSPMSEDLDEFRYCESNACSPSPSPSQTDSQPTSPVSPYRFQKLPSTFSPGPTTSSYYPPAAASQARQRGSDSEGRFPSSPSDICHSADLRRAALLRSVQMRTQPSQFEEPLPCPFNVKSLVHEIDTECSMHGKSCRVLTMNIKGDDEATD